MDLKLYKAYVIDIDDEEKKGRVKIKIFPEFEKIEDTDLPWAVPFNNQNSENCLTNDLPEQDSTILVLVDKYFKRFYYLTNAYFQKIFDYAKAEEVFDFVDTTELDKTYKDIKFRLFKDGSLEFHNNNDGSHGFIQSTKSWQIFDKEGNIHQHVNDDAHILVGRYDTTIKIEKEKNIRLHANDDSSWINILNDGNIEINGNERKMVKYEELVDCIKQHLNSENGHTHICPACGANTSPPTPIEFPTEFDCKTVFTKAD